MTKKNNKNSGDIRDKQNRFVKGLSGNPTGRPKETEETKAKRKALRSIIKEYKQNLAEALPAIQPVLITKALEGDIQAIKEIHDRTMDKARQNIGLDGGDEDKPIPILNISNDLLPDNSDKQDNEDEKEG